MQKPTYVMVLQVLYAIYPRLFQVGDRLVFSSPSWGILQLIEQEVLSGYNYDQSQSQFSGQETL